ncbi:hypothetical protein [Sulfurisoma sediminicola]|uniref:Lipoprotein n=1 Tax=Sulfurisoma sediminicola TaxID=1381557 RepID=A0A497XD36_9PROT|nr:hypothetical protein [Sulfurisoma sediminicola]RLJ64609.1 hypothetical protein DFR35_1250 [Sulfurisoma sediminicola]
MKKCMIAVLAVAISFATACSSTEMDITAQVDAKLNEDVIPCVMTTLQYMTQPEKAAFMKVGLLTNDMKVTDKGQKYFKRGLFCYGRLKVEKVTTITDRSEPSVGMKATEVKFTAKLVDIADWATDPEIEKVFPRIKEEIANLSKSHNRRELIVQGKK